MPLKLLLSALCLATLVVGRVCPVPASNVAFKPLSAGVPHSFFFEEGQALRVKLQLEMPRIIIQVRDSFGNLDTSTPGITITAESDKLRLGAEGRTVAVHRGEAHFTKLMVDGSTFGSPLFQLRFNVTARGHPIHGTAIVTGFLTAITDVVDVWALRFPEDNNFVTHRGQSITVVPGIEFPAVRVEIITSEYRRFATDSLLDNNYTIVATMPGAPSDVTLLNAVARAVDGGALFNRLMISTTTSYTELPPIEFVLLNDDSLRLSTGPVVIARLADNANIGFEPESVSFIYGQGQSLTAQGSVPLPIIRISLRDTMFRRSPPQTNAVIIASCEKRPKMSGTIVGVVDGIATFDQLTFLEVDHEEALPYTLTFSMGQIATKLRTGIIMVSSLSFPATSIRFLQSEYDSFFTAQGQAVEAVLYTPTPAVSVELLTSSNVRDDSTEMSIFLRLPSSAFRTSGSVSCESDTGITRALTINGVATFSSLLFTASNTDETLRLTFMACGNSTVAASGTALVSGPIRVIPVPTSNSDMRFQPFGVSLFSKAGVPTFATVRAVLPPIVVELTTSTGAVDSSSSDIGITVSAPGVVIDNSFLRVSNGMAVFRELMIVTETVSDFALTFTAGQEGNAPVAGKRLITGNIKLVTNPTPAYGIKFHNDSYIAYEGHTVPITLTQVNGTDVTPFILPPVLIQLVWSDHTEMSNTSNSPLTQDLQVAVQVSSGRLNGTLVRSLATGIARFDDISIEAAFDPVLTFCVESRSVTTLSDVENRCISSGSLTTYRVYGPVGGLRILNASEARLPVVIDRIARPISVYLGQSMPVAIGLVDTTGVFTYGRAVPAAEITASSNVQLRAPLTVSINTTTGIAYFDALAFAREVSAGLTPVITFTARFANSQTRRLLGVTTGLISVIGGAGQDAGVDLVAELLVDEDSFDWDGWRARLCRRLNIETARVVLVRRTKGSSAVATVVDENSMASLRPTWEGTRVDFRVMEPLPTSRTTKRAQDLAELIVALKTNHESTADLYLRRAYLRSDDIACDVNIYDEQISGARDCIAAFGKAGYCDCHVPMFRYMGTRCLGLESLTTLCLDTLLPEAECKQPEIVTVCRKLEFPDAPRTELAASGAFLFLFVPPLMYMWFSGYFHKLSRPSAKKNRIQTVDLVVTDASDLL